MLRHKIIYAALAGVALVGFSPGAEATKLGVVPPSDDAATTMVNEAATVGTLRARTIAAEIFGGTARHNSGITLTEDVDTTDTVSGDKFWLMLHRPRRGEE